MKFGDWLKHKRDEWKVWSHTKSKLVQRNIEYARLKRIRKQTTPQYSYCKNCGTKLMGMYCYRCGQYALDTEQPFWKYVRQYFENVYQFEGKVWQTLYRLFASPGFLTKEFNLGKINSYVHPFKLYMFIATVFFMAFFYMASSKTDNVLTDTLFSSELTDLENVPFVADTSVVVLEAEVVLEKLKESKIKNVDSLFQISPLLNNNEYLKCSQVKLPTEWVEHCLEPVSQKDLPKELKNFLTGVDENVVVYEWKALRIQKEKTFQIKAFKEMFMADLSKYTPFLMMFLLPVFALMTRWFFRKSQLNYMSHFVCALHINSVFLLLISIPLVVLFSGVEAVWVWKASVSFFLLYLLGYMLVAFKRVFGLQWLKTFQKTMVVYILFYLIFILSSVTLIIWLLLMKAEELGSFSDEMINLGI